MDGLLLPATKKAPKETPPVFCQSVLVPPRWSYLTLVPLLSVPLQHTLDPPTVRLTLLRALSNYLGEHGSAVPVDVLAINSSNPSQPTVTIRVPHQDGKLVAAAIAISGQTGLAVDFRLKQQSDWLSGLSGGDPEDLFEFSDSVA